MEELLRKLLIVLALDGFAITVALLVIAYVIWSKGGDTWKLIGKRQ